jgi:hypothetical protein
VREGENEKGKRGNQVQGQPMHREKGRILREAKRPPKLFQHNQFADKGREKVQLETVAGAQVMRKRKPRKTEFTINELPENIQKKVLDRYRDWNVEDTIWAEDTTELFKEDLKPLGFNVGTRKNSKEPTIYWSGFCSQGDGASFEAGVDLEIYIKSHIEPLIREGIDIFTLRKILKHDPSADSPDGYDWELENSHIKQEGHYCHEMTMDISLEWRGNPPSEIESALFKMQDIVLTEARDLAKGFYKTLEKENDYQTGDQAIRESLECSDKKFTIEGEDA